MCHHRASEPETLSPDFQIGEEVLSELRQMFKLFIKAKDAVYKRREDIRNMNKKHQLPGPDLERPSHQMTADHL